MTVLSRRSLIESALSLGAVCGLPASALGMQRRSYGGSARLHLPLRLAELDPHDPESLAGALLGAAVFDALYATTSRGTLYPALAAGLPEAKQGRVFVTLRPGLRFASGQTLDARRAAESIRRSQKMSPTLAALGTPGTSRARPLELSFRGSSKEAVGLLLSNPRSALVAPGFSPRNPVGSGAMRVVRTGSSLILARNERAPRGASYLDGATIQTASVADCLRAFEARRADLGFLGAGLHRPRKGVARFQMRELGLVVCQPGNELRKKLPVGSIHEALARVPGGPLAALGVERTRKSPATWRGEDPTLLVSREEPWLAAIARELATAWSGTDGKVLVTERSHADITRAKKSGRYSLLLRPLSLAGADSATTTKQLFRIDGGVAPKGGRVLSPTEAGRLLRLGIVGTLKPRGAVAPEYESLVTANRVSLETAEYRK